MNVTNDFLALKIPDWKISGGNKKSGKGGQASVLKIFNKRTRKHGMFRVLRSSAKIDVLRFERELKILLSMEFRSPYLINILDSTKDSQNHWYISELGAPFYEYWMKISKKLSPDKKVLAAIGIIQKLSNGLKPLHKVGAVHRDIKPANIVVVRNEPVLIDFGLAYEPFVERISDTKDAVGNLRYSPDQMMNRMDDVPSFLDVYMLIQVFIWMIMEKPIKSWSRPLDWRWVRYDEKITIELLLRIRALTAICSDYYTAPKNCDELDKLISKLFNQKAMATPSSSFEEIKNIIAKGRALSLVDFATDRKIFEDAYPLFITLLHPITSYLLTLEKKVAEEKLGFGFAINSIENFAAQVRNVQRFDKEITHTVHSVHCGSHPGEIFYVSFTVIFYPVGVHKGTQIPDLLPIDLRIYRTSSNHGDTNKSFQLGINSVGEIFCMDPGRHNVTMEAILSKIENLIFDPEVWGVHKH